MSLIKRWLIVSLFILTFSVWLVMGCSPRVVSVEVTKEVPPITVPVEVTRLVTQVVPITNVVTESVTTVVEVTSVPAGSPDRPILLVFPPTIPDGIITGRTEALVESLSETTGQTFEVQIAQSMEAAVDLLCTERDRVITFLPALPTVWAEEQCAAVPSLVGVHFDVPYHVSMIVIRIEDLATVGSLADLAGKRWGIPGETAVANYQAILGEMERTPIEHGEPTIYAGDTNALLGLLNQEVDFVTVSFNPPILPFASRVWDYDTDSPEVWRAVGINPYRAPLGYIDVIVGGPDLGGYRIRDVRAALFDANPNIFSQTYILTLGDPIPNGAMVIGATFPWGVANQITQAMQAFGNSEACLQSICSPDFYNWEGVVPAFSTSYTPVRSLIDSLNYQSEQIFAAQPEF